MRTNDRLLLKFYGLPEWFIGIFNARLIKLGTHYLFLPRRRETVKLFYVKNNNNKNNQKLPFSTVLCKRHTLKNCRLEHL